MISIEQNDPALNSSELENTLIKNEREAVTKTERVSEWKSIKCAEKFGWIVDLRRVFST